MVDHVYINGSYVLDQATFHAYLMDLAMIGEVIFFCAWYILDTKMFRVYLMDVAMVGM